MIFERFKSEGTAHNSYLIGSGNDAVVIDPRRDCKVYSDLAEKKGLKIKYILETHRNEDYLTGSPELHKITGAQIFHGPGLAWRYGSLLEDGQIFNIGNLKITAIHTPGHTDESMSYSVVDTTTGEEPVMVFTGDALFVGDVGRTDLRGEKEAARMSASLYDSIFNKILPLGDEVIICPAHGGGSVCGMHIAYRDESTLGLERKQNPALQVKTKNAFIKRKVAEKPERPYYFLKMEKLNLEGPPLLNCMPLPSPLTPREFRAEIEKGAVVIDTSEPAAFGGIHIKCAYNIWVKGLPVFAGWVLPYDHPLLLIIEGETSPEIAVRHLVRSGYDNIVGYLKGGIESWYNAGYPFDRMKVLSVHELKGMLDKKKPFTLLDTRGEAEWRAGHIEGAMHIFVGHLEERLAEIPEDKPVAVYCNTGHRASLSASILLRAGYKVVYNVPGSVRAWTAAGFPLTKD